MKSTRAIIVFTIAYILWTLSANSQRVDSLQRELNLHVKKDTMRALLLLELFKEQFMQADPDSSLAMINEALAISKKEKWLRGEVMANSRLGIIYGFLKADYAEGLNCYLKALKLNEQYKNQELQKDLLGNIGLIYHETRQYKKSEEFVKKALDISRQMKLPEVSSINILTCHANNLTELQEYNTARTIFYQIIALTKAHNKPLENGVACSSLGTIYMRTDKLDSAIYYLAMADSVAKKYSIKQLEATALQSLAIVYLKKKQLSSAQLFANNALKISEELQSLRLQSYIYEIKTDIFIAKNDYKAAYDSYVASVILKDSISSVTKREELGRLETRYEFEKKEAVAQAVFKTELEKQRLIRNALASGSAILVAGGLLSFFFYRRRRNAVEKQKEAEFKSEVIETEMKALRAQMNPHFIFNSLNSIGDFIAKNNTQLAGNYLSKFAKLMRLVLENSEKKEVMLADDLKALELYMQLEAVRLNNKFSYQIKVDEDIDPNNTLIPPLILQPFIENSIWHGIAKKEGSGNIIIHIKKQNDMMMCVVEDDGVGRTQAAQMETTKENKSLGMKITAERIDLLNRIKKAAASVHLSDLLQGTRVEVKLPLHYYL
jgi:tetratricopeptide (TPR) repeat protein